MSMSYGARSRLLLLCPGQGGQHAGMFDLARTDPAASALLAGLSLPAMDGAALYANRHAQPLIVAATLAMWEALREDAPPPALVAGYSIGELAAYGVAGAWSPVTALRLAARRAALMDDCARTRPGQAMLALSGLTLARAAAPLDAHGYRIAIETGEDAFIAGGPAAAAGAIEQAVMVAGGRCTRLPVEVASHTPYMAGAVAPFAEALRQAPFQDMRAPVLAGVDAATVTGQAAAVDALSRQLSATIRWMACMDACAEAGITCALELGPGAALSRMLRSRHPHIDTRSAADFRTLDGIRKWLERAAH